ncbi:hypothetical protein JKP88DRAFT_232917 [Tribonema minus]|uniref:2Fe-2S ferredoxin-type domain-containing protein n=1 Tax=Tribonema minus TaxID=303371 RepID=A0A835ZB30_9STRA|nr:hypothetical protein JKP88DRAFT_232917 [Tribonema minus]
MAIKALLLLVCTALLGAVSAFVGTALPSVVRAPSSLYMAQCIFPGGKKAEGKPGEALKAVVAKAKYDAPYGCEEGKCGSCEHKVGGKKVRLCIGKVPPGNGPHTFTQ